MRAHRLCPVLAALLACALLPAAAAEAKRGSKGLRPVGKLRLEATGAKRIVLSWRDRARRERRYEVRVRRPDADRVRRRFPRGTERAVIRRLKPGTAHGYSVRPCRRGRCGRARSGRATTLLAPFGGPHPDPGCEILPPGDELNRDVSSDPVDPRSDAIIARILADGGDSLHPDFGSDRRYGIPYVVVPPTQPGVPIRFTAYGDESDRGPYPIPPRAPIEGGRDASGDRHVLVVRRPRHAGGACDLFELYRAFERRGRRGAWSADSGAVFDLGRPLTGQRPAGWTSADAAGLPIFPGLVRREEIEEDEIDHAIRITFERTRRAYVSPATHWASDSCHPFRPAMGMRLRLKATYPTGSLTGQAGVIARALQRYGAIVADNGSNFFITGSTDRRWNDGDLGRLKDIPGSAFEVVAPTSPEVSDC